MLRTKRTQSKGGRTGELSQSEFVTMIIVVVSFAIVLAVLGIVFKSYFKVDTLTCAAQLREANARNRLMGREEALLPTACQTKYITLKRSELPENWDDADKAVKKRIADTMVTCWRDWGEGELDLFNSAGNYCAPCADIIFDPELKALYQTQTGGTIEGFPKYLGTEKVLGTKPAQTYHQFLTGKIVDDRTLTGQVDGIGALDLNVNDGIDILYSHQKKRTDDTIVREVSDLLGVDLSPQRIATGVAAVGEVATIAGATLTSGPVGVLSVLSTGSGASTGFGMAAYFYARQSEEFTVVSATYITPRSADNKYVEACNILANPLQSP